MARKSLFDQLLAARGLLDPTIRAAFLSPDYHYFCHDPFLLPDMAAAVERLTAARNNQEKVVIYGDYDIDGLTATTVLLDAFAAFGIKAEAFIPNRFVDGYGLSAHAIRSLAEAKADVIVTVDCGSLSHAEIAAANDLHVDVIVTDHHSVADTIPPAVAVVNPKRSDHAYPFVDLAGVGVAFKLVQALQQRLEGLPRGQEKWLLDLVAFGTVCDVVDLIDENRANVFWGLKVMSKTRRPGLKALMAVAGITPATLNARALGFGLGPRLNAAGRIETARLALDLLTSTEITEAQIAAERLDQLNRDRRAEQDRITKEALQQSERYEDNPVLVLSDPDWSHGIVGIVAARIMEIKKKPTFILQELGEESKGSARSYGDFSAVEGIKAASDHIIKGGGHPFAAGVTIATTKIPEFRKSLNAFYTTQKLKDQPKHLDPKHDVVVTSFDELTEELCKQMASLEPYGRGNPQPILQLTSAVVTKRRTMGADQQHLKLELVDSLGKSFSVVAFGQAESITAAQGQEVNVWIELGINEWQGYRSVQGYLKKLE